MERDPKSWCRAFQEGDRFCVAVIVNARAKVIITILEEIRTYVMERTFNMSQFLQSGDNLMTWGVDKGIGM